MGVYMETVILGSEVRPCADFFLPTTGCSDSSSLSMYRVCLVYFSAVFMGTNFANLDCIFPGGTKEGIQGILRGKDD